MSKFTVSRKALAHELKFIGNSIGKNSNIDWGFILFEIEADTLFLTATDGMATSRTSLTISKAVDEPIIFAIPGPQICTLVNDLDEVEELNFSIGETKTTITGAKGSRYVYGQSSSAVSALKWYTSLPIEGESFQLKTEVFVKAIKDIGGFASAKDKTQYSISGVSINAKPDSLNLSAMDGTRGIDFHTADDFPTRDQLIFVGKIYCNIIGGIAEDNASDVIDVVNGQASMRFTCGNRFVVVRQMAVNIPAVSQGISKRLEQAKFICTLPAAGFAKLLRRVTNNVDATHKRVFLDVEAGLLKIYGYGKEGANQEGNEEMEVTTTETMKVAIDANMAIDFLKLVNGDIKLLYVEKIQTAGGIIMTSDSGMRYMMTLMS